VKVHHLNCSTLCPPLGLHFINSSGTLVCHCLVVETEDGLVLVDTGLGVRDMALPGRIGAQFGFLVRPKNDPAESALIQLRRLGFKAGDVRHIVATHLDLDHCGALPDFPDAKVHVYEPEFRAAMRPETRIEKLRYKAVQWAHHPRWERYPVAGETWFGFEAVRGLAGLPEDILLVPLVGHTRGHAGVAVKNARGWLLHAGDAYFHEDELDLARERGPRVLEMFQASEQHDGPARLKNRQRLRELKRDHGAEVTIFCAHDPAEFARAAGAART
jgi:glyoxylase-like metal-dependent hydrolase (beta-lactamase superfamily II)